MTSSSRFLPLTLSLSLILAACGQPGTPAPDTSTPTGSAAQQQTNAALHTLARQLAVAVMDPAVRTVIAQQAALEATGDTEALYSTLAVQSTGTRTFAQALSAGLGSQSLGALTAQVPNLHVAVRGGAWDGGSTPLVAVAAEGGNEYAPVTAYDAQGRVHILDARKMPDSPILVVGVNERVDANGAALPGALVEAQNTPVQDAQPTLTAQGCYAVHLGAVRVIDDMEPWTKGDAEIYLAAKAPGLLWHGRINEATDPGHYAVSLPLGCADGEVKFYWYERDGANLDFEISVAGTGFGIKIDDDNDFMGSVVMGKWLFDGATTDFRDMGNVAQYTY